MSLNGYKPPLRTFVLTPADYWAPRWHSVSCACEHCIRADCSIGINATLSPYLHRADNSEALGLLMFMTFPQPGACRP